MSQLSPPFWPSFGTGAPGASVPRNNPYYDTSTTPYTPYVWSRSAGAWRTYGVSGGAGNATQIQGVPVDTTPPSNGQTLVYNQGANKYIPGTVSASTPTIVQVGTVCGTAGTVTMPGAPVQGNLLVAIVCDFGSSLINGTGWNSIFSKSGSTDGLGYGWKLAGASEPATQTPTLDTSAGIIAIWEISVAGNPGVWFLSTNASTATPSLVQQTFIAKQLVVGVFDCIAAASPTGVSGVDHFNSTTGGTRGLTTWDVIENAAGAHTISATYAVAHGMVVASVIVGP